LHVLNPYTAHGINGTSQRMLPKGVMHKIRRVYTCTLLVGPATNTAEVQHHTTEILLAPGFAAGVAGYHPIAPD
jgi:hypothetical protein